ncbi:MAG: CPBP family glutamic-type intramembrane protease [Terrimicrobiaceae bacterium]|nr:CPBP family glutamic-type intramembrane protease [Terrimicrobiaceae bacterium]
MNRNTTLLLRLLVYVLAVVVLGCLLAPPLYWAGSGLAAAGILPFLEGFPFHRYFSRSIQISALVLIWPAFRWIGITRLAELGIAKNPHRWRDAAAGLGIGVLPVIVLAAGLLWADVYAIRSSIDPTRVVRIAGTAVVVSVLEEFLFRAVILGLALRAMPAAAAAVFSSAVFSIVHFMRVSKDSVVEHVGWLSGFQQIPLLFSSAPPWPVLGWGLISLMIAGLLLAWATLHTRSLFLAMGIHAGWILGQQGFQSLARFRPKPPDSLLPWVGPNVVSGAVPTGVVPTLALLATAALMSAYLMLRARRYQSARKNAM